MYFNKTPHPANFEFAHAYDPASGALSLGDERLRLQVESFEGGISRISLSGRKGWERNLALSPLNPPAPCSSNPICSVDKSSGIQIAWDGKVLLGARHAECFGVSGEEFLFAFEHDESNRYYGLGEKCLGRLEMSHVRTRFWNTDVLGDFPYSQWKDGPTDPYYVSVPYVIVRKANQYVGLLLDNLCAPFVDTGSDPSFFGNEDANRKLIIGASYGKPVLWVIVGPSLAQLTQKLQKLVGVTPRPPLWALGYHQCRWGYKGEADLVALDAAMRKHGIPCDGLWLDIDYMDGYRVFTTSEKEFPNGVPATAAKIAKSGRRVVPILDPGVKKDPDYAIYKGGAKAGVFCKNLQGKDFTGFVWPGLTVFPDFTLQEGREWWAGHASRFRKLGFGGAWLDMNDPATGAVEPNAMLFEGGKLPHSAMRNQYALGMQMATRAGFQAAVPNERVFLLSRSGCTGTSNFSAIWTGDNVSNRFYLKGCIPTTLNLSLSGIPFNGNDIGGFFESTTDQLMLDWTKACFLFPFFRVHSVQQFRAQEPWTFKPRFAEAIIEFIRLRYKLLPYLYNLFLDQEAQGDPILRPLNYHFAIGKVPEDQFLVGESVLQAPFVGEGSERKVRLPGRGQWFDLSSGKWLKPGVHRCKKSQRGTPLFVRDGAILPVSPGEKKQQSVDLGEIEFHIFALKSGGEIVYRWDDGISLDYQKGKQSAARVQVKLKDGELQVDIADLERGFGPLAYKLFVYGYQGAIRLNGKKARTKETSYSWLSKRLKALAVS